MNKESEELNMGKSNQAAIIQATAILTDTHYADAYYRGYSEAREEMRAKRIKARERKARKWYFIKQRLCGVLMLVLAAASVKLLDGDITATVFMVPLGLALFLSKEMLIVNQYYWEHEEEREE